MSELYHHGITGMKWGRRNGPPYPLEQSQKSSAEKRAEKQEQKKSPMTSKDVDNAKTIVNESKNTVLAAHRIADRVGSSKKVGDVKKLSEAEMQSYIKRANLERQYTKLKQEEISNGQKTVTDILDTVGDALAISSSVLTIAVLAKTLANKTK